MEKPLFGIKTYADMAGPGRFTERMVITPRFWFVIERFNGKIMQ
jgi:hypothetical protein